MEGVRLIRETIDMEMKFDYRQEFRPDLSVQKLASYFKLLVLFDKYKIIFFFIFT